MHRRLLLFPLQHGRGQRDRLHRIALPTSALSGPAAVASVRIVCFILQNVGLVLVISVQFVFGLKVLLWQRGDPRFHFRGELLDDVGMLCDEVA